MVLTAEMVSVPDRCVFVTSVVVAVADVAVAAGNSC